MPEPWGHSATSSETTEDQPDTDGGAKKSLTIGIFWVTPRERFDELRSGATLGRASECEYVLEGSGVSRRHAVIERDGPIWSVRDLGSRNGTFFNGMRRGSFPLSEQDTVRIGDWVGVVCRWPELRLRGAPFAELEPDFILSAPTLTLLAELDNLAPSNIPIVVVGETGTGKEMLVRAIHSRSRRSGALVAVNCAAIPEGLAEGQLFGHKKGAFTGALETTPGHVGAAHGGTLLLDEIMELPMAVQSKLLRVLEERAVVRLGSSEAIPVDFRLIVTSQEPLQSLVAKGEFRGDLYARANGAELRLPPLRQRRQEVLRLLTHVMTRELGLAPSFDSRLVECLCRYDWPYNIREVVQLGRLLSASGRARYDAGDLPQRFSELPASASASVPAATDSAAPRRHAWLLRHATELARLKQKLEECHGNLSEAARQAGVPRYRARRLLEAESSFSE